MRFFAIVLALATSASASIMVKRAYPSCANPCLVNPNLGGCSSASDLTCVCNSNVFISSTSQCFNQHCSGADLDQANQTAQQACLAAGVTLTSAPSGASSTPVPSATSPAPSASASSLPTSASVSSAPDASNTATSGAGRAHSANLLVGGAVVLGAVFAL
ncbi:hypothetical protein K488DRAFT_85311 [Vararia minispora EC-137]|uniref:Uncharacterized protein n=1 Tax=Vararia minispora EC-137 TaxID=1314806 RepID=A0ACB8QMM5_9AGAM|nr:hypothetical protein K488DRAFT_85311 [Vararia minispora EC-137]